MASRWKDVTFWPTDSVANYSDIDKVVAFLFALDNSIDEIPWPVIHIFIANNKSSRENLLYFTKAHSAWSESLYTIADHNLSLTTYGRRRLDIIYDDNDGKEVFAINYLLQRFSSKKINPFHILHQSFCELTLLHKELMQVICIKMHDLLSVMLLERFYSSSTMVISPEDLSQSERMNRVIEIRHFRDVHLGDVLEKLDIVIGGSSFGEDSSSVSTSSNDELEPKLIINTSPSSSRGDQRRLRIAHNKKSRKLTS